MNILLLGSGGREHAFAWKISQSPLCKKLFIATGNAGTEGCGTNIPLDLSDFVWIKDFVLKEKISMLIAGPEEPLVKGIHDFFLSDEKLRKIPVIGPQKNGAQLEGSKDFSKQFMEKYTIPTARYKTFDNESLDEGLKFLETLKAPYVLKADGLAAGKGVVILSTLENAKEELRQMLTGKFGTASSKVVIEEYLHGIELSVFVLSDGKSYKLLPSAKDYKRIGEGDTGPNTGGMGAVSPVPFADRDFMKKVEERIVMPTIKGLKTEEIDYRGFIFIGLMNVQGDPYVIEYNCRMGDPETEVVLPRIKNDIVEIFIAVAEQKLDAITLEVDERTAVTVMVVAGGYPGSYEKGNQVFLEDGSAMESNTILFHAGTKTSSINGKKEIVTNGGRVISVTSFGKDIAEALDRSYKAIKKVRFKNMYFRKDIGADLVRGIPT